jgi:hypothetical protein
MHAVDGDVPVLPERGHAEEVVAERIHPVHVDQVERVDDVAERLRHLPLVHEQVPVHEELLRDVEPRRHQQGGPDDAVELEDVLGEQMTHLGPEPRAEVLVRMREAERAPVVDERVDPDVHDLRLVPGHRHAPVLRGPADADVFEPSLDEAPRLVVAKAGSDDARALVVEAEQRLLIGGETEEVVLLLHVFRRDPVLRAEAVDELVLGVEGLAARAVEAGVQTLENVAAVIDPLEEVLDQSLVPLVRRPHEEVVRRVHAHRHLLERRRVTVDELLEVETCLLRDPGDVGAVLVRPGQEERFLATLAAMAHEDVGRDRRIRVPDVRRRIDVIDRRRDVEGHRRPSYGRPSTVRPAVSTRRRREFEGG